MADIGAMIQNWAIYILDIFLYVIIGLGLVGLLYFLIIQLRYNKVIIIRKVINGRRIISNDKAREITKDGITTWRLLKRKKDIPVPNDKAIEITKRGKEFVEFYETVHGEFHPMIDSTEQINSVQPFTTNQRMLLKGQMDKAQRERGFKFSDHIGMFANLGAIIIIVISLMVFYGDMAKPLLQMGDKQTSITNKQGEIIEKQTELLDKIEVLLDNEKINENKKNNVNDPPR